jgi:hypothetical protein
MPPNLPQPAQTATRTSCSATSAASTLTLVAAAARLPACPPAAAAAHLLLCVIQDLEAELAAMRAAVAEESSRAQRVGAWGSRAVRACVACVRTCTPPGGVDSHCPVLYACR